MKSVSLILKIVGIVMKLISIEERWRTSIKSSSAVTFAMAIGCFGMSATHAEVIGPFDTQIYLANSDYTRFLPIMESPSSGQGVPFVDGGTQFAGSSILIEDNVLVSTDAHQGSVGPLQLTISIFTLNHANMFPQGVTFPDGVPANNLAWVVGGSLADRDGSINDLQPFPSAAGVHIGNGSFRVFDVGGSLAQSVSFTGAPSAPNADFFATCCGGVPESIGRLEVTLDVSPIPEPSTLLLLTTGFAGLVGYGWRRKKRGA